MMNVRNNNQISVSELIAKTAKYLDESKKRRTALLTAVQGLVSDTHTTMTELDAMRKAMDKDLMVAERQFSGELTKETLDFIGAIDADERQEDQEEEDV